MLKLPQKSPTPRHLFVIFPWELPQEQKQGATLPQLLLGSSWHDRNDFFHVPKCAGYEVQSRRTSPLWATAMGRGRANGTTAARGGRRRQLALIKAWQHSLRPTALFTLAGGERAALAFAKLVAGPICPGSIGASGEPGEDREG